MPDPMPQWQLLRGEDGTPLCEVDIARRLVRIKKRRRDGSEGMFLIDVLEVFFCGTDDADDNLTARIRPWES
jgi:hypothetical protein